MKKSKTLALIKKYHTILEQDEQNLDVAPQEGDVTEQPTQSPTPDQESQESIPLSSPAELRYMQDVVMAALMEPPSGNDRITLENILDLLKMPDADKRINANNMTARDMYQQEVLPIIRPAQQDDEIKQISNTLD